jgi:hypothetical protein
VASTNRQRRGQVLVHDGLDAAQAAGRVGHHRDAAASGPDDDGAMAE